MRSRKNNSSLLLFQQEELIEKLKGFEDSMTNREEDSIEPDTADFACQYDDTVTSIPYMNPYTAP